MAECLKRATMKPCGSFVCADPRQWDETNVAQWLCWAIREFSLEGVAMHHFHMKGKDICAMGKEAFLARAPPFMGDILWEHLEILQKGRWSTEASQYRVSIS
jgi:hypothetical protein